MSLRRELELLEHGGVLVRFGIVRLAKYAWELMRPRWGIPLEVLRVAYSVSIGTVLECGDTEFGVGGVGGRGVMESGKVWLGNMYRTLPISG